MLCSKVCVLIINRFGACECTFRFAKVSYTRTKDAMDVCLLYVALGKKKVLSALAKLTQSESNKVKPRTVSMLRCCLSPVAI